ncbi:MAG: STAS domain-containing protein [Desulfobulbaceae bacterium]|nr:STAS domain-containing protein [Desulfobulbaceae bacterium]
MELLFEPETDYCVVKISGRLDAGNIDHLKKKFSKQLVSHKWFVFNLTELDFMDSSGLGAIISCLRKAVEKKGDIKLVGLTPKVKMVFEITRADQIFGVYNELDAALASMDT